MVVNRDAARISRITRIVSDYTDVANLQTLLTYMIGSGRVEER